MQSKQAQQLCVSGSQAVYEHVTKQRFGGAQEIAVQAIEKIADQEFKFKLARSIYDLDSIAFLFSDGERRYFDNDEISILVYDQEQRFVLVKTSVDVAQLIRDTIQHPSAWALVFDLKFLIKRVIQWFENNGDELTFLEGRSKSKFAFDSSVIFSGAKPSKQQMEAIKLCFDEPLTYIWGAPGTGKTRFVLSYAILNYIKHDAKVLILAPTNLALEQVFRGVISTIEIAGISKRQLLRLGTPTKTFATEHGEVCEDKSLDLKISQLERQIDILESIKKIDRYQQPNIEAIVEQLSWLDKRQKLLRYTDIELQKLQANITSNEKNSHALTNSIKAHEQAIEKAQKNTTKRQALENSLAKLRDRNAQLIDQKIRDQECFDSVANKVKSLRPIVQKRESEVLVLAAKHNIDEQDLSLANIKVLWQDSIKNRARLFSIAQEYEQFAEQELLSKLNQYRADVATLSAHSTKVRLLTANVIGMTLDSFMAKTKDRPMQFDHVFIDEAGYASLVKTLPVFITRGPITLLGDHKQLPPVCEFNRDDILAHKKTLSACVWDLSAIHCESFWLSESLESLVQTYQDRVTPSFSDLHKIALTQSYRFGKKLTAVLEQHVYTEEGFQSGLDADTQLSIFNVSNQQLNDRLFNDDRPEKNIGRRANVSEAYCVQRILEKGIVATQDYVVLTPYRDQVSLLAELSPELNETEKLMTVHKSQGREWHTVIYCVCDIGNGLNPWFTDSENEVSGGLANVNTAVSRAKQHLIIVCDSYAWQRRPKQLISGLISARSKRYTFTA